MGSQRQASWPRDLNCSDIPALIRLEFDWLTSDQSFARAVPIHRGTIAYSFAYELGNVAVEPVVDRKDSAIEVCLVRLIGGLRPGGWRLDESGQLVRVRLFEACWFRRVPSPKASIRAGLEPADQVRAHLQAESNTLRRYFPDILSGSDSLFVDMQGALRRAAAVRAQAVFFATAEALFKQKRFREFDRQLEHCPYALSPLRERRLRYARRQIAR